MLTEIKNPVVLLVEDSDDDAFFFRRTLQKSGMTCAVHHLTNGGEAIDFLQSLAADAQPLPLAIFLDLKMPLARYFQLIQ